MDTSAKKFAWNPVVCRGCGYIINKESYAEVDGKAYHVKCEVERKLKGEN